MNYLSHQYIARKVRPEPTVPAMFFAGNLLPDLLAIAGDGRLRSVQGHSSPLADGVRLHLATDKLFHSLPAFHSAQAQVTQRLVDASWQIPLRRRFFVAHVMVELALDSALLAQAPGLPEDLYQTLSESLDSGLVIQAEILAERPVPNLENTIKRFIDSRFLYQYATPAGLSSSMVRIGRRTGILNFEHSEDAVTLARIFADLSVQIAPQVDALLCIPPSKSGGDLAPPVVQ